MTIRRPPVERPAARFPTRGAVHFRCVACRAVVLTVAAGAAAAGCDPPPAKDLLVAPEPVPEFGVAGVNVHGSVLDQGEDLVVRFTRPLDRASFGPRSLTVTTSRRRRISGASARIEQDALRIPGDLLRALVADETAVLRIEGGASPCAVRAGDGERLPDRFVLAFRRATAGPSDLEGPVLTGSRPADGAADVAPGTTVELRFSEPVAAGAEAWGDVVTLRADGVDVPARLRLSSDRRRLLVRPASPLGPGAAVEVDLQRCLVDDAGNPVASGSTRRVAFRVRSSALREIDEDFSCDEFLDRSATDCAWGEIEAPGVLVARCGTLPLPVLDVEPTTDLGDRDELRFQVRVGGDEVPAGFASGLRLRFARTTATGPLRAVGIEGGAADAEPLGPSFQDNRDHARLEPLAVHAGPFPWEPDGDEGATVDVPFGRPLPLTPGRAVLLDVVVAFEPGARLAAAAAEPGRALLRGAPREHVAPAAVLLVAGASPAARSLWYDSGDDAPRWRSADVETLGGDGGVRVVTEFQCAPADGDGQPDLLLASPWETDPSRLPAWRFVRFRLRFEGAAWEGSAPLVDRVSLHYEPAPAKR